MTTAVVVPAAGSGRRMQGTAKPLLTLSGLPVIVHALKPFLASEEIDHVMIVCRETETSLYRRLLVEHGMEQVGFVAGGEQRQDSVYNALKCLRGDFDRVLVHDAVRPFVDEAVIGRVIAALQDYSGAVAGVPVKDTVKMIGSRGEIRETLPRECLWAAQTPQGFSFQALWESHLAAAKEGFQGTDDAVLLERRGLSVCMVEGSYDNIKLTTPEDIPLAEALMRIRNNPGLQGRTDLGPDN